MLALALIVSILLSAQAIVQAVLVAIYIRALVPADRLSPSRYQPPAAVILCLRGADPKLDQVLRALVAQTYEDFEVVCVVDDAADPAVAVLEQFESESTNPLPLRVMTSGPPTGHCSLKCHALVAAIEGLDPRFEVIAMADADCVPDKLWLADLAAPLEQPHVVATSGNQWYLPPNQQIGTLVRYLWYTAATVQMYLYTIPWGGAMALSARFVHKSKLLERWKQALFEDTYLAQHVSQHGGRIELVAPLLVPNTESASLQQTLRWMTRQLINVRLYHRRSWLTWAHCVLTSIVYLSMLVLLGVAVIQVHVGSIVLLTVSALAYFLVIVWLLLHLQMSADRVLAARDQADRPCRTNWISTTAAMFLTQWVYLLAVVTATFAKRIQWRGVRYDVAGPFQIKMYEYRPMSMVERVAANQCESVEV